MDISILSQDVQLKPPQDQQSIHQNIQSLNNAMNNELPGNGEKSIVCWNCLSVLVIKEEWGIVQCTNCSKFNRIPGEKAGKKKEFLSLDDDKNHFELCAPYVYVIMTCPYCQMENKVRKEAEHIVCFKCKNSFAIQNPSIKVLSSKEPIPLTGKTTRFSDVYEPHQSLQAYLRPQMQYYDVSNCHNCSSGNGTHDLNVMVNEMKKPKPARTPVPYDRYAPIKQLIRDVNDIGDKRARVYNSAHKSDPYLNVNYRQFQPPIQQNQGVNMNIFDSEYITQDRSHSFMRKVNFNHLNSNYSMKPLNSAVYNSMFPPYQRPNYKISN